MRRLLTVFILGLMLTVWGSFAKELPESPERQREINPHVTLQKAFDQVAQADTEAMQQIMASEAEEMPFVAIEPGTFQMGSPRNESDRFNDESQHSVRLTRAFEIGATEVTQKQWFDVMENNPSRFSTREYCEDYVEMEGTGLCPNHPVEQVSWDDVQAFLKKLNQQRSNDPYTYRLPTEAEWEYAARADTTTPFNLGENITTDKVNYDGNHPYKRAPKGEYREQTVAVANLNNANDWKLFDMHGNVSEWVQDWYGDYPSSEVSNPTGPASGSLRVERGGSWYDFGQSCRSAFRNFDWPDLRDEGLGFRLVRTR